ncbi:MAG: DUF2169 domain-containing protein [Candidatus Eisenbacteria bacterium]|uniref:DUF2169 domain-containing protein n=1 Tax=Eiseniibacteriota bacterium TaxID=2212470 RepID=A0A956LXQ8_UNCEI|nr:DUF2169 domain-containing protein [Candidatus Eisenbacteria bacterium]
MLELVNDTPFAAAILPGLDKEGVQNATVIVKGTFLLPAAGANDPTIAEEQVPIVGAAEYYGDPEKTSIRYDTDMVPAKPGTDVVLVGCARSARPLPALDVTLAVGPLKKTVRVFGERRWSRTLGHWSASKPQPFVEMPLVYERAFGGWDTSHDKAEKHDWEPRNPVGTGFNISGDKELLDGMSLPNLEDPADLIGGRKDRPKPAGFGFVGPNWKPRVDFAGTYDQKWLDSRAPLLPDDFDDRFFNSAHPDLIAPRHLAGGEAVAVSNVSKAGPLRFAVPRQTLEIEVTMRGQSSRHTPRLDTLLIEPDANRAVLCWRVTFPCPNQFLYIETIRVRGQA